MLNFGGRRAAVYKEACTHVSNDEQTSIKTFIKFSQPFQSLLASTIHHF